MIGHIDCDFLIKLVACNLFGEAIASLRLEKHNLRIADSARFSLGGKQRRKVYGDEVCDRAVALAKTLVPISAAPNHPLMGLSLPGIDVGELVLLSAALAEPAFYLATGDKNFMRSLGKHNEISAARAILCGRIVCLEQAVLGVIALKGFDYVKKRVVPAMACDTALKAAFGSGEHSERSNCVSTLEAYIAEIKKDCPDLLADL